MGVQTLTDDTQDSVVSENRNALEASDSSSSSDLRFGFVDGTFDELGGIWFQEQTVSPTLTGDALIDYLVQQSEDPAAMLANIWQVTGDAKLVKDGQNYGA